MIYKTCDIFFFENVSLGWTVDFDSVSRRKFHYNLSNFDHMSIIHLKKNICNKYLI